MKWIKKLLGIEYEISNKPFLRALCLYPHTTDKSSSYRYNITKVWATVKDNKTTVHIKTHLPGFLIGRAGSQISEIREYMEMLYGKPVEIDIVEEDMFDRKNWSDFN